jgi:glycosyltransferase involved in cell wall biosynthesis
MGAAHFCARHNLPYTSSLHTTFHLYARQIAPKPLRDVFENAVLSRLRDFHNRASLTMMPTDGLIEEMKGKGFTSPLRLLSRGVDFDLFHPGPKTMFEGSNRPVALFVGRISEGQKNIRAFLDLDIPDWRKVVVGDGPDLPRLKKLYAGDPSISFVGKKKGQDLAAYYRSADVFVMPSVTETFGNVTTEALASGLPVAALSSTANDSILGEDFLGATDTDLARAFAKAVRAPGTAQDRHAYVREHYTWPKVAGQFMANIREARPDLA